MTKKVKIIIWSKLVEKMEAPYEKKYAKLFSDFDKEVAKSQLTTTNKNDLWRKKYQKKFEAIEKAEDAAYTKLYKKYHDGNKPKAGYKIVIK